MADAFSTTSRPIRPDSFMKRAGRALVGFGEGYAGRGQEYLDSLRAERERKNSQLTDASIKDAMGVKRALESNNTQEAIAVLVDRANILERMGEDTTDTLALRDLIVSNNLPSALSEVDSFLSAAQRRGLIQAPSPIESKYVITDPSGQMGTMVPDASGNMVFRPATGAGAKPVEMETYTGQDGIERYSSGAYTGYSVGYIADLMRSGQIRNFGDPIRSSIEQNVRPPMRIPDAATRQTDARYQGLSSQEIAFLQDEERKRQEEEDRLEDEATKRRLDIERLEREAEEAVDKPAQLSREQELSQTANLNRLNTLQESRNNRVIGLETAQAFLQQFKSGNKSSGALRQFLSNWNPFGTYTEQGEFDEALDAFAEFAARERLKASGEIRPTDADVQGAKQALFGVGRDEQVNIRLLEDFIRTQLSQEQEFRGLLNARNEKTLADYVPQETLLDAELPTFMGGTGEETDLDRALREAGLIQ
jgi:hypothetical protein